MIKKIRNIINIALSAIIVALGFGSCVSQKAYNAAQEEINTLRAENEALMHENANLRDEAKKALQYRQRMEERKVVYGPRPTGYNENINK